VDRHLDRLAELAERVFALQFFGATGTLGSLGDDGPAVQRELADELDLALPSMAWFAGRDRFAEYLDTLAEAATTLERIAQQVLVLNRPEIGELGEPPREGEIGSSTMLHKVNPVKCERAVALARLVRGQAGVMTEAMAGYDGRDFGTWYVEFAVVPETCCYFGRQLRNVLTTLEGLEVHPDRMLENLDIHGGLVASEAVMMALAEHVGRQTAHEVVHEAAMTAQGSDRSFRDYLAADDRVTDHLDPGRLATLTDHRSYVGNASRFVDATLERTGTGDGPDPDDPTGR
jgi:adenylosuccinate lyase